MAHGKQKQKKEYKTLFETQITDFKRMGYYDTKGIKEGMQIVENINIEACNSPNLSEEEKMTSFNTLIEYEGFYNDINKNLIHYFIQDDSLVDFLKNTKIENTEIIKDEIKNSGTYRPILSKCLYDKNNVKAIDFCVHSKNKAYYIFACKIEKPENFKNIEEKDIKIYRKYLKNESEINTKTKKELNKNLKEMELIIKDQYRLVVFESDGTYKFNLLDFNKDKKNPLINNEQLNFALNFLFYKNAFPDTITNGIPQDLKIGNTQFLNINRNVKTEPILIEKNKKDENGKIIPPHIRSGHFRYLGSDFFKNKQGQTIFIPATMVNARAETFNKNTELKEQIEILEKNKEDYKKTVINTLYNNPTTHKNVLNYKLTENLNEKQITKIIEKSEQSAAEQQINNTKNNKYLPKTSRIK